MYLGILSLEDQNKRRKKQSYDSTALFPRLKLLGGDAPYFGHDASRCSSGEGKGKKGGGGMEERVHDM